MIAAVSAVIAEKIKNTTRLLMICLLPLFRRITPNTYRGLDLFTCHSHLSRQLSGKRYPEERRAQEQFVAERVDHSDGNRASGSSRRCCRRQGYCLQVRVVYQR